MCNYRICTGEMMRAGILTGRCVSLIHLESVREMGMRETHSSPRVREQKPLPFLTFVPGLVNARQSLFSEEPFELDVEILMNLRLIHN